MENKNWLSDMPSEWPQEVRDTFLMVRDITGVSKVCYRESAFYYEQLLPIAYVPETYHLIRSLGVEIGGITIDPKEQRNIFDNTWDHSLTFISIGKDKRKGLLDPRTMGH